MKILLTLDFPPEIGGIQKYLYDIVLHTYGQEDMVLAGSGRPVADADIKVNARTVWLSTPFSKWNKKLSLVPMLWKYLARIFAKSELFEVECGNVFAAIVPWVAGFITGVSY
jgi:hypothetical protein